MVSYKELVSRVAHLLRFNRQELIGLAFAVAVTAFVFSFRDWGGDQLNFSTGLTHFLLMVVIASLSFFFRLSCQKIYALANGYRADFRVWWAGLLAALIISFVTVGRIPLVLIGAPVAAFMVKQRLGEYRHGLSYGENAVIAIWGIYGNLIAGILFAIGLYIFPQSYFFWNGLLLNIIMAWTSLLPFPSMDGLSLLWGFRGLYLFAIVITLVGSILLLSKTGIGLIAAIIIGIVVGGVYAATMSDQ